MSGFFWILVAWVVINAVVRAVKTARQNAAPATGAGPGARPRPRGRPVENPEPRVAAGETVTPRRELADVIQQIEALRRRAEVRSGKVAPVGGRPLVAGKRAQLPSADAETLEAEADETSDQDAEAERLVQQRIREAEAQGGEITDEDYAKFEQKVRQDAAAPKAAHERRRSAYTPQQLRDAFVWREILGPPAALREQEFWT
jgi:hypothetical protein